MDTSDLEKRYDLRKTTQKTPKARELIEERKKKEKKDQIEVVHRYEGEEDTQSIDTAHMETTFEENYSTNGEEEKQSRFEKDDRDEAGPSNITMETRSSDVDQNKSLQNMLIRLLNNMRQEMKEERKEEMNDLRQDLSQKIDNQRQEMKEERKEEMKEQRKEMKEERKEEMNDLRQDLGQKINDQGNDIGQEMKKIHQISATISTEITGLKESVKENKEAIKQIHVNFQQSMQDLEARFEARFQESSELQEKQIEKIINVKTNNISNVFYHQLTETRSTMDNQIKHLERELNEQQSNMKTYLMNTDQKVCENEKELVKNIQNLGIHEKELEDLRKVINQKQMTTPPHITVTCTGSYNGSDVGLPKYGRRSNHPMEFLGKLKNYFRKQTEEKRSGISTWEETLEMALEDNVSKWWQSIRENTKSFNDFENKFIEKYWSHEIQRGIRRRIELEKYRPNGRLNRSEFFIERVLLLNQMTPRLEESDIITILSERYDEQIQDARRVQDIRTVTNFEKLLSRFDIEEDNRRLQYANTDRRPNARPTEYTRYADRGPTKNLEGRSEPAYQNRPYNPYREPVRRTHPYTRDEPKEGYNNRPTYSSQRQTPRQFDRQYQNGYKYPENPSYRNYNSREQPANWNHKDRHFKQEFAEVYNSRGQKYKTPEQEAVCQSINIIRTEPTTTATTTDNNQLTREQQTTHNNSAHCSQNAEN